MGLVNRMFRSLPPHGLGERKGRDPFGDFGFEHVLGGTACFVFFSQRCSAPFPFQRRSGLRAPRPVLGEADRRLGGVAAVIEGHALGRDR